MIEEDQSRFRIPSDLTCDARSDADRIINGLEETLEIFLM